MRLLRTGRTEGVSPAWAAVGMTINLAWLTYVVEQKFWVTIPSIIAAEISFAVALYLLYRNGADLRAGLLMSAAVAVASVGIQMGAGWTVLGTVLGLSNGLYLGPSVIAAWRSHVPVGVSPATWWLTVLEGLKWGFYGVLVFSGRSSCTGRPRSSWRLWCCCGCGSPATGSRPPSVPQLECQAAQYHWRPLRGTAA